MPTIIYKFYKPESTFANGDEALADRSRLLSPEFKQSNHDLYETMLSDGIITEPTTTQWDQATHTLSVVVKVGNIEEYDRESVTYHGVIKQATIDAGWDLVEKKIID